MTIIVLLILAGIAINLTVGNNGLFARAQNATNAWRQAEINEQSEMQSFANTYDGILNNLGIENSSENNEGGENGDEEEKVPPVKTLSQIVGTETENTDTKDKNGNRIVVPAGFKVINPESTVSEGIVIEDVSGNNANTVGNQFVWIPCTLDGAGGTLKYDRYAFTRESPTWDVRQSLILGTNGEYEKDSDGSYKIQRADQTSYYFHEALEEQERVSIEKYGGFYIGRYEAGCDIARTSHTAITATARVKLGLPVYNYVTREEAVTIAERMYVGKSRLCSSYAWDTALKFIDGESGTYAVNSIGDNNRTTSSNSKLENTGYHEERNIYDMGGNVYEWTTETCTYTSYPCALRRGILRFYSS